MISHKTFNEQLLYTTVRIQGDVGVGTGFFYRFKLENETQVEIIITNKHVVNGNTKLSFVFHEAVAESNELVPNGRHINFKLDDFKSLWIEHPDENVDLGAILLLPIREHIAKELKKSLFCTFIDNSLIKSDSELENEADVADDVLMVGYPIGLTDDQHHFPIIRKGITSSYPALDFNGQSVGVVDIACFPGSSGSPILYYMVGYLDKNGNYNIGATKVFLLGILSSGPIYTASGEIEIKHIPTDTKSYAVSLGQMIHLGYYVKSKELLKLCTHIKTFFTKSGN